MLYSNYGQADDKRTIHQHEKSTVLQSKFIKQCFIYKNEPCCNVLPCISHRNVTYCTLINNVY